MLRLVSERLHTKTFHFLGRHKLICWTVYIASIILFFIHSYVTVARFLEHDVQRIVTTFKNDSLPMPIVMMQLESVRKKLPDKNSPPLVQIQFDLSLDNQLFPQWALVERRSTFQHYLAANLIDYQYLTEYFKQSNITDVKANRDVFENAWPLKSYLNFFGGIAIQGKLNASQFIEASTSNEGDFILAKIASFDTDSPSVSAVGLPYYQLLPCEELQLAIALEYHSLRSRSGSPCRNDYPQELLDLIKSPLTPELLYNPVFAPNLPYNENTCKLMCMEKYWLPKCGCYFSPEIWRYAGKPANFSQCSPFANNSSICLNPVTPVEIIDACKCFPRCDGYRFRVVAAEKIRHKEGKFKWKANVL